jgi:radical SAM protein with 4Fe4S-binding SPASM domain
METKIQAVSWNITRLCNLKCTHCYLPAGFVDTNEFPSGYYRDSELTQSQCFRVIDEIAEVNPNILLILTGGEPLLRPDILKISDYAARTGFLVVMGTNGVLLNDETVQRMSDHGVAGVGISLDAVDPVNHDKFRGMEGAWEGTMNGVEALKRANLDFLVQTSVTRWNYDEVPQIVDFAYELGAKVFNLYFLVRTGRGKTVMDITPAQYERMLSTLFELQAKYHGKMLVAAKCAPHYKRVIYEQQSDSPFLQAYPSGTCPCGIYYCRITPEGDLTPCPYMPVSVGNLKKESFATLWNQSKVFQELRDRKLLEGKCGVCEFRDVCGGCRARAYALTDNYLAEDPSCEYQPGQAGSQNIRFEKTTPFAAETDYELQWTDAAQQRLERVPSFARGMVTKSVEKYAREHGYNEITPEIMKAVKDRFDKTGIPSFRPRR